MSQVISMIRAAEHSASLKLCCFLRRLLLYNRLHGFSVNASQLGGGWESHYEAGLVHLPSSVGCFPIRWPCCG